MRFAELPVGGYSVRGRWTHWEELRLTLPESPDNAKLMLAVPELDWNIDAHGVYSIHFDDAVELWADLLDIPLVKDSSQYVATVASYPDCCRCGRPPVPGQRTVLPERIVPVPGDCKHNT